MAFVLVIAAFLLALPAFVAAPKHRAAVEAFASRLTGRDVHINGALSLSYWPQPEITASGITITGPNKEVITAHGLALDLALPPLLHGQIVVRTLDLDTPTISFPWPLPGGVSAVSPPPWLAALHAHIDNGLIRFGEVNFADVDADLFTGPGGSLSVSGTGQLAEHPVSLSVAIGKTATNNSAPLSIQGSADGVKAMLSGTLNTQSELHGALTLQLPGGMAGKMQIEANANSILASNISLNNNNTNLAGQAKLGLNPLNLEANLTGDNVNFSQFSSFQSAWPRHFSAQIDFNATNILILNKKLPSIRGIFNTGPHGSSIKNLSLGLPGGGNLTGNIALTSDTHLSGHVSLSALDLPALTSDFGLPPETAWTAAHLQATLGGSGLLPKLKLVSGTLGQDHVSGQINLSPGHAAFRLAFDRLELVPLAAWLGQKPFEEHFIAEGELTAEHADAGPVKLSNLFVDAALDGSLNIRRASASLYNGVAGGNVTLGDSFKVASAHAFLDIPSATPLAALAPAYLKLPSGLLRAHLNLLVAAAGPPEALSTSAVAKLGDFTLTAAPVIDLTTPTLSGAVSLRHPNAIAAMKLLGFNQGCTSMAPVPGYPFQGSNQACIAKANDPSLAFPGPGALSLGARFVAAPNSYGLSDFVLSAGLLNASGQLLESKGHIIGQIDAGTLVIPPVPSRLQIPRSLPFSGVITLKAGQILYAGERIFGPSAATLTMAPDNANLTMSSANFGNGNASGNAYLRLLGNTPPTLNIKILAQNIDFSALNFNENFPFSFDAGQANASANLTAQGYTVRAMAATLGGNATLSAKNGIFSGLSLPGIAAVMHKPNQLALYKALKSGSTPFTTMTFATTISKGNCSLTQAVLTAPSGKISAIGDIDLFDSTLALKLDALPALNPPLTLTTRLFGAWEKPGRTIDLHKAANWMPAKK
ncbi:MAG: AsmA family protein [Rhodospirillales bacterium]|nr:AsmA family protein [Rhodospirillales bacterium]MDE2319338.1 AsmA family protein [Rhodospirillales bacterium]